jgi:hypothetical protein
MNMDDKMVVVVVVRSHPNSTFKNNGELWIPSNPTNKVDLKVLGGSRNSW